MARTALAILGAAALAATAHAAGSVRGAQKGAPDVVAYSGGCTGKSWQFLMMVEQWSPTVCSDNYHCDNAQDQYFTLHGLWPNNYDGSYPCTCTNDQFNLTTVKPLVPQLLKYWPSYKCNDNDDNGYCDSSFWAHEYEKHGTCALGAPGISDQYQYFETTLSLRNKYAILPALANKGIYPSDDDGHYLDDIKNAVKAYNGGSPSVWCDNDNNISSFITCYDSQLQPTDCPSNDKCSGDKVYMPTHA